MRTIIDLPEEQIEQLRRLCRRKGISRAEAVRRGVELLLDSEEQSDHDRLAERRRALDAAFGMWKDRGMDAVEYQRQLRAEWDRDVWNQ
jgi:Arc/MetJ-type ribon-helix-helix transcriptional regulator